MSFDNVYDCVYFCAYDRAYYCAYLRAFYRAYDRAFYRVRLRVNTRSAYLEVCDEL
jgi:hypothetical protein